MTMPAIPMKDAAERYSPEIAEAFQPTETERPATKKSEAVLDLRADQKPIQIVATTVMSENPRIQGSACLRKFNAGAPACPRNKVIPALSLLSLPLFPVRWNDE